MGNAVSNTVSVIATATNTVAATVAVGNLPTGIAITANGNSAYVSNAADNTVSVINTATNSVVATIPVGTNPIGLAITLDGALAYVCNGVSNNISVISTASNTVVATIPGISGPVGVAIASPTAPQPPTNLTAAVGGGPPPAAQSVTLSWTASPSNNVVGYNVYRGTTSGGPFANIASVSAASIGYTDITVVGGTTYYYVVTTVGLGNAQGVNSNEAVAVVP